MIRISTIFIAICMVLVAASLGLILYSIAGLSGMESAIVALTALTFLILYNAVSMRLRDRTDVGSQIADLSRGTADLARQVAEFGRRLAAVEGRVVSAHHKLASTERTALADADDRELRRRYDSEFRQALISNCGSRELMRTHAVIFDKYFRYALQYRGRATAEQHGALLGCALKRDSDGAKRMGMRATIKYRHAYY